MTFTHTPILAQGQPRSAPWRAASMQLAPICHRVAASSSSSSRSSRTRASPDDVWVLGLMGCSALLQLSVYMGYKHVQQAVNKPPQPPVQVITIPSILGSDADTLGIMDVLPNDSTLDISRSARQLTSAQVLSALQAGQVDDATLRTWVNSRLEISQELKDKFYWHEAGLRQLQQLAKTEKKLGGGGAVHQVPSRVDVKGARRSETTKKVLQALCNGLVDPNDVLNYLNGREYLTIDMYRKLRSYGDALDAMSEFAETEKEF